MSRLKSLFYSLFVAPRREYSRQAFDVEYFVRGRSGPDEERARYYLNLFRPSSVLDVGCGTGELVWGFRKNGIAASGIEISEDAISSAAAEVRPHLMLGDVLDIDYPEGSFDLVTCNDVLEHVPSSQCERALDQLYRVTRRHLLLNICLWLEGNARKDATHINLRSGRYWKKKLIARGYRLADLPRDLPFRHNAFIVEKE